jgi:integrase
MATKNLTKAAVEALAYNPDGSSRQVLWDARLRGFGCRVTPEGGKSYVILYRANGRQRLMSLGPVQTFKALEEARRKAETLLHGLRHEGLDPMAARERMAKAESMTEGWAVYEREHFATMSASTLRAARSLWRVHLAPVIGALKPGQITRADVIRVHDRASNRGGRIVANRAAQQLRAWLSWLQDRSDRQFPAGWRNPCVGLKLHREHARTHILDTVQMRALLAALEGDEHLWTRAYVAMLMLTGARKEEIRTLRWADVNLERGTATLMRTKNGKRFPLPITPQAVAILRALPVIGTNPYVFPQARPTPKRVGPQPMIEPRRAFKAALKRARLPTETTFHDLRRSYGTLAALQGATAEQVARALNNTPGVAARVYIQLAQDVQRRIAERNAEALIPVAQP